jgi:putative transposase
MTWRETGKMDERLRFVAACLAQEDTMVELCAAFGILRKTGYKWLARYREGGAALPRAPRRSARFAATAQVP